MSDSKCDVRGGEISQAASATPQSRSACAELCGLSVINGEHAVNERNLGLFLYLIGLIGGLVMYAFYKPDSRLNPKRGLDSDDDGNGAADEWTRKRDFRSMSFYKAWLGIEPEGTSFSQFRHFTDRFKTFNEVRSAMRQAGVEDAQLIIGIDFTASNEWQGRKSYNGNSLHTVTGSVISRSSNPYQRVIAILGEVLEPFTSGSDIHAFGFGDIKTKDHSVFYLHRENRACANFNEVLKSYNQKTKSVQLSGPTSYAPLLSRAIQLVKSSNEYHILVIIADGQMPHEGPSVDAVVRASSFPLSIVMVGVGDGPWTTMEEFDDRLPARTFDNFQFVNFSRVTHRSKNPETSFALHALMEIPDQYKAIKSHRLLNREDENENTKDSE